MIFVHAYQEQCHGCRCVVWYTNRNSLYWQQVFRLSQHVPTTATSQPWKWSKPTKHGAGLPGAIRHRSTTDSLCRTGRGPAASARSIRSASWVSVNQTMRRSADNVGLFHTDWSDVGDYCFRHAIRRLGLGLVGQKIQFKLLCWLLGRNNRKFNNSNFRSFTSFSLFHHQ